MLNKTESGSGGEIQFTDAIGELLDTRPVEACRIVGKSHDCGTNLGYMQAQIEYALRDDGVGSCLSNSIQSVIKSVKEI